MATSQAGEALGTFFGSDGFPIEWREGEKELFWILDDLHCPNPVSPLFFDIGGWWLTCDHMFRRFGTPVRVGLDRQERQRLRLHGRGPRDPSIRAEATEYEAGVHAARARATPATRARSARTSAGCSPPTRRTSSTGGAAACAPSSSATSSGSTPTTPRPRACSTWRSCSRTRSTSTTARGRSTGCSTSRSSPRRRRSTRRSRRSAARPTRRSWAACSPPSRTATGTRSRTCGR